MEGAERRTSRRGEKIESVSREVEMKKEEGGGEVVARVRKYEIAGRSVGPRQGDALRRRFSSLSRSSSRKEERNDRVPNVAESEDALSLLFAGVLFKFVLIVLRYYAEIV